SLAPFTFVASSGGFGSAAPAALATTFSVLLGFTAPQMMRIKIRIPTWADFILSLVSSCAPLINGQRLLSRPGSKSAYETKRSRRSRQKKNSALGTVADGFQRTSPHLRWLPPVTSSHAPKPCLNVRFTSE